MIRPAFLAALIVAAGLLASPRAAGGQEPPLPDATPTWWHEAAGLTPLLTAPPPPNPATICLIDTGVTPTPDLDITARWAYDGGTPDDVHATTENPGHGTVVAHFAAGAVNGWGGAGAFPHGRISSVRVFPKDGGASWREYIAAISRCLKLDSNTKVIVISIGGQEIEPGEAEELEHHIGRARDRHNVNVVVAAGNGGGRPDFPGRFTSAVTVTGATSDSGLCPFSALGDEVDLAAPGCGLPQSGWGGGSWTIDGTSFAAPIVAGGLAALRSYSPEMGARDAEAVVTGTARPGRPPSVDIASAFHAAGLGAYLAAQPPGVAAPVASGLAAHQSVESIPSLREATGSRSLRRPRVTVRRRRGERVALLARNRPKGVSFEVRSGRRHLRRRVDRILLRGSPRSARCRFVAGSAASRWTFVRW